jgi:2-polyprenyl-6-methoxyphenol hydroxylase-like FAD-dependent oxidoreductase
VRVLVVGGGPGGLFFALLAKRSRPDLDVRVVEQNPEGATYGWGIVFTDRALEALRPAASDVIDEIARRKPPVEHMDIVVGDERRAVHGNVFFRIGRAELLALLTRHARAAGVAIHHGQRFTSTDELDDADLVVGADGVNSAVRELFADSFAPEVRFGRNWWAWYGTTREFAALSLIFEPTPAGLFVGHAYQYDAGISGFVAEVVPSAFDAHGIGDLSDAASRALCERVFGRHLDGATLLDNRSSWFHPKFVTCEHWSAGHITLLGDALHTVHPSIGSGTRFAMRDAVALAQALTAHGDDVQATLRRYEAMRRPRADAFQAAARRSITWYEGLAERDLGDPTRFAIEYIMRTGQVRYEQFRRLNPELIADYERPRRVGSGLAVH